MSLQRIIEKIKANTQTGIAYAKDPFDLERFKEQRRLLEDLTLLLSGFTSENLKGVWGVEKGYATPKVDVRAAIFKGDNVLLCKERSDGKWTLPGGWADIGESPSENAIKEVKEETGLDVRATKLAAIYDRDKHDYPKSLNHVYKMYFICEIIGGELISTLETSESAYFSIKGLPELSTPRVTSQHIQRSYEHLLDPLLPTDFD